MPPAKQTPAGSERRKAERRKRETVAPPASSADPKTADPKEGSDPPKVAAKTDVRGGGEFRSSADVGFGLVSGIKAFDVKRIKYSNVDGLAMFEGDIALGTVEELKKTNVAADAIGLHATLPASGTANDARDVQNAVAITGQRYRWPGALIPYQVVDPSIQSTVDGAIEHWQQNTSIRFALRTPANAINYPNYVSFEVRNGCFSSVGMQGGEQVISIGLGCQLGQAIHEIGHTVGLWHEQSREDRDQFVHIAWENILPNTEHNFDQHINDGDDIGPYDYGSIMHYPAKAFSSNGLDTIVALAGQPIGQREGLSISDIAAVRELYPGGVGGARHMYTSLILELAHAIGNRGFKSDGVGFYGWSVPFPGAVPLLKLSDPQGKQLYTTSLSEAFEAISKDKFAFENVPCYVFSSPVQGLTPLFRLDNADKKDSLFTTSVVEAQNAASHGYAGQGVAGHVMAAYLPGAVPVYRLSKGA